MAGDWIKMTVGLRSHPKVVRMASALKADRLRIVGGLHAVWGLFDQHSVDGVLEGYCLAVLDEEVGWPGFGAAMAAVGWLQESDDCLCVPRFDTHNGASAKRRALDAERKRSARAADPSAPAPAAPAAPVSAPAHGSFPEISACDADKTGTRERGEGDIDDDDPRAGAQAGAHAGEAPAALAGEDFDDPSTAAKPGQWLKWFADRGHELDSTCDRTRATLRRWIAEKVTAGEVARALARAATKADGPVGDIVAYADTVVADRRTAALQAGDKPPMPPARGAAAQAGQGTTVPTYEESRRAAAADDATKPDKQTLADRAKKAREEAARIAANRVAPAPAPTDERTEA